MCGITGILAPKPGSPIDRAMITRMTTSLSHRGPDGDGIYIDRGIGLGHRRLAIIDIAGGKQPMTDDSEAAVISFNGEIYNFEDLRKELIDQGCAFSTNSDTEVLLKSYLCWGADCVHHLRGMFAFAIWDRREKQLFLARDRVGVKPLYYAFAPDGSLLFASEMKALLAADILEKRLRLDALDDYLALSYVPDPKSIYEDIHKLAPGHRMIIRQSDMQPKVDRYWRAPVEPNRPVKIFDDLLPRLEEAVRLRMISDVPLGAFLSGGIDSSTVVMLMAGLSDQPVKTCAIGADDPTQDESQYADGVADHFNTHHRNRYISTNDRSLLDILTNCFDEPFADNSALPTYRVCGLARESVTVALSGDGGDELFGGYRRYQFYLAEEKLRSRLPYGLRKAFFGPLGRIYPKADWAPQFLRAKTTFESLSMSQAEAYFHTVARGVDRDRYPLYSQRFKQRLDGYHPHDRFNELADEVKGADPFSVIQYIDLNTYIPGCILTKVDRTSMAHSLEVRVPILDHQFLSWAVTLSSNVCLDPQTGKKPLRSAIRGKVPDDVLDRKKQGFSIPVGDWMKDEWHDLIADLPKSDVLMDTGLFDQTALTQMIQRHREGARNHGDILWSLVVLEKSLQRHGGAVA